LRVLYDTNVILYILRKADSIDKLQVYLNARYLDEYISIVTVAEIRSLAIQFNWGEKNLKKMEEFLADIPTLDINLPDIITRYVDIDCYSKRKHPNLVGNFSAITMGKNDLWIAATASFYGYSLITMDRDFQHLHDEFVNIIYLHKDIFT
jgi:tRNA(fMet)-specific endonuclease VapC